MSRTTSHSRFDPAKLLLGLALLAVAGGLLMRTLGEWDLSYALLILAVPAALLLSGLVAAADRVLRVRRGRSNELR
ncbi:hypothetical protein JGS22_004000 [Streptomyces sp. P38-E01]|uniref:Uncharacterized protein n=1 Tax=Streptomyces tardus TaxID=2780544 RepID=A0A949JE57_9ACTN|nr:hypothetical protein [Streptomyces tardus]MBU7596819.1 hypothetical protein [Streptomyces tardus]